MGWRKEYSILVPTQEIAEIKAGKRKVSTRTSFRLCANKMEWMMIYGMLLKHPGVMDCCSEKQHTIDDRSRNILKAVEQA